MESYTVTVDPHERLRAMPGFYAPPYGRVEVPRHCTPGKLSPVVVQHIGEAEATPDEELRRSRRFFWIQYIPYGLPVGPADTDRLLTVPFEGVGANPIHAECLRSSRCLVLRDDRLLAGLYMQGAKGLPDSHTMNIMIPSSEAFALLTVGGKVVPVEEKVWQRWLDVDTPFDEVRAMV